MPQTNRMSLVISLILLGLILLSTIQDPGWPIELNVLGSPLTLSISRMSLIVAIVVAITCVGTETLLRAHPALVAASMGYTFTFWILPVLVTVAAALMVPPLFPHRLWWLASLAVTYVGLAVVFIAEYRTVDPADPGYSNARLTLNLVTYVAAFVLYVSILGTRVRSLLSATAVILVTIPLCLELLRSTEKSSDRTRVFALLTGLVMGEMTWALNYWSIRGLVSGILLVLIFYVVTGIAQQHLLGRLTRRVLLEFAVTAVIGFTLVLGFTPWLR